MNKESKRKMSEAKLGENNPMYGKTGELNPNYNGKHSLRGEEHPNFGKHLSYDQKKKLSEKLSGSNHPAFGKTHSLERREKHSKVMKEYWSTRKEQGLPFPEHKHKNITITQFIIDQIENQYSYLNNFLPKDNIAYIYILTDPTNNNAIRYVGKSEDLKTRLNNHILNDYKYYYNKKTCWIVSLLNKNVVPTMHIIETCTLENWEEKEIYWIKYHKDQGCDLVNSTEGGDGISNPSEEILMKKSQAMSGDKNHNYGKHLSEETKSKISQSLQGHDVTTETREKLSLAASGENNPNKHGLSESHKARISESHTNNTKCIEATKLSWQSPEVREARTDVIRESWEDAKIRESRVIGINNYWESDKAQKRKENMVEQALRASEAAKVKSLQKLNSPEYKAEVEQVKSLYLQGLSVLAISKNINKSQNYVKKRLISSGIQLRNKSESFNNQYTINLIKSST